MWRDHRLSSIVFALMLVLVCAGLLAVHFGFAYTSDDVAIQTVIANWRLHTTHTMRYLILVPFYGAIGLALLARAITNARVRLF